MRDGLRERDWWICLDSWILQDGNYTDFAVGQVRQFALEFGYARHRRMRPGTQADLSCQAVDEDAHYAVTADLIRAAKKPMKDCFILDFGLLAYAEWMILDNRNPPAAGSRLEGQIHLSVDHFAYMDYLARRPGMPALIYTWRIDEIRLDTSAVMTVEFGHPLHVGPRNEGPTVVRDPDRRSWRPVEATDTWGDDGSYTLRCTLLDSEAATSMGRSGPSSPYGPLS